ncbi:hypothetical protein [Aquipseudomonas alcaligenes]|uniref:Uncharacterized protein n=1 Tax=Aquipseudomonas alcaligenes TaxID=43263 RepID=A0A5C7W9X1_AQUAC|nr:hypothetical protein [Pseudomonas alcaligenes]MDH0144630.1 hypothetical protein [Pseudomonas alcaligenes]TXI34306.1 MAG: hypothetical protein E6Q69_04415 [Pseudomonas alcaligenes]
MNKNVAKASLAGDASRPEPTVSPYGERKTDRILTGTPFSVNTKNRPFIWRQPLRYQALRKFKQTFVLDAEGPVYIMPSAQARESLAKPDQQHRRSLE